MTPWGLPLGVMLPILFVLGCLAGRLSNTLIDRFPKHERLGDQLRSIRGPRRWWTLGPRANPVLDRLPIIGWLRIRERGSIPIRYLVTEVLSGLLFAIMYWRTIPTGSLMDGSLFTPFAPDAIDPVFQSAPVLWLHLRLLLHLLLVQALLIATLIDYETYLIPDGVTVPVMLTGLLAGGVLGHVWFFPAWYQDADVTFVMTPLLPEWAGVFFTKTAVPAFLLENPHLHGLLASGLGLLIGGGSIWMLRIVSHLGLGREGMGFGDVTLMAAVGSIIGWQAAFMAVLIGVGLSFVLVVLSAPFGFGITRYLAFGPFLAAGTLAALLFWSDLFPLTKAWLGWGPLLLPIAIAITGTLLISLWIVRGIEALFGIQPAELPWSTQDSSWRPADQTFYLSMENVDPPTGQAPASSWPGEGSGRGQSTQQEWQFGE